LRDQEFLKLKNLRNPVTKPSLIALAIFSSKIACLRPLLHMSWSLSPLEARMTFESPQPAGDLLAQEIARQQSKGKLFLRLFLQNERRLYAYVLTLVPNRADADDVFQDASLTMWDKFDSASPPDDFAAWGCRIAYFKVLDFRKKTQRSRLQFNQELLERLADTAFEQAGALQLDERRAAL